MRCDSEIPEALSSKVGRKRKGPRPAPTADSSDTHGDTSSVFTAQKGQLASFGFGLALVCSTSTLSSLYCSCYGGASASISLVQHQPPPP